MSAPDPLRTIAASGCSARIKFRRPNVRLLERDGSPNPVVAPRRKRRAAAIWRKPGDPGGICVRRSGRLKP